MKQWKIVSVRSSVYRMIFDSLDLIHTNQFTFSYNDVLVF